MMAALRYATRAYVAQGDPPEAVLTKLSSLVDFDSDIQFATVLIGEFDPTMQTVNLVSAGRFPPLPATSDGAEFLDMTVGTPIGMNATVQPLPTALDVPTGPTLVASTDGLIERPGERLDVSLNRLREEAMGSSGSVEAVLEHLLSALTPTRAEDDVVVLGIHWPG
jgi:serine phosphatase RsbU (regulator of sigma subunit)